MGHNMEYAFDHEQLQALCVSCHSRLTLAETKSKDQPQCT
jgi:hypothetical protein